MMMLACSSASGARVEGLYAVDVELPGGTRNQLEKAFDAALRQVLIKVTGRRSAGDDTTIISAFGDSAALVQQYRIDSAGTVWVLFDTVAVKRILDELGQPVWGEERPATLVWLVMDAGSGKREFLAAGSNLSDSTQNVGSTANDRIASNEASVRAVLEASANARAVPLILPLVDSAELSSISVSDVWGGFTESLMNASTRYGADAVLIGRARVFSRARVDVRWTLLVDDERYDWDGDISSGPDNLADFFAARLARVAGPRGQILLQVDGVDSLDAYGRLSAYLAALEVVDDFAVKRVAESEVLFSLSVRGDADLLMRIIALQRVLQLAERPADLRPGSFPNLDGVTPDLRYQLIAGP
jgi:hypothetical protein